MSRQMRIESKEQRLERGICQFLFIFYNFTWERLVAFVSSNFLLNRQERAVDLFFLDLFTDEFSFPS